MAIVEPAARLTASRLTSLDALRGTVMVVMALDHVRDFIHAGAMAFAPEDLSQTTPALFLTRWITHVCAPAFLLTAGAGIFLRLRHDGSKSRVAGFLLTRGFWLVAIELTIMRLVMNFSLGPPYPMLLLVLYALGMSMVLMSGLIFLPWQAIGLLSLAIVLFHNALADVQAAQFGDAGWLWTLSMEPGFFPAAGIGFIVGYPVLPWLGVMGLGFCAARILAWDPEARQRALVLAGSACVVGFVVLRALNGYGDPSPWTPQATSGITVLSFLSATKYPPSLAFVLMTLGPVLLLWSALDRWQLRADHPLVVIGRVPLFYYVLHFFAAHAVAAALAWLRYGSASLAFLFHPLPSMGGPRDLFPPDFGYSLPVVYIVWIAVVAALYPCCRWFADVKARRKGAWWASYL